MNIMEPGVCLQFVSLHQFLENHKFKTNADILRVHLQRMGGEFQASSYKQFQACPGSESHAQS